MELDRQNLRELTPDWETDGRAPTSLAPLELDSMYLVTLLDQLRQISELMQEAELDHQRVSEWTHPSYVTAKTRLDQLHVRISTDLRQVQEAEQYDDTPSDPGFPAWA